MSHNYLLMSLPDGYVPVRFARIGGQEPVVDLRSLLQSQRIAWGRWDLFIQTTVAAQGRELRAARDWSNRPTQLLWASGVPSLLAAMAVAPGVSSHTARKLAALAQTWRFSWRKVSPPARFTPAVNGPSQLTHTTATLDSDQVRWRAQKTVYRKLGKTITRQMQQRAQELSEKGLGLAEIARVLTVSRATASLLARNIYRHPKRKPTEEAADFGSAHMPGVNCATCASMVWDENTWTRSMKCSKGVTWMVGAQAVCMHHKPADKAASSP